MMNKIIVFMTSVFVHLCKNDKPAFSKKIVCSPPPPPPQILHNHWFHFSWVDNQLDFPLPPISAPKSPRMSRHAKSKIMVMQFFLGWRVEGVGGGGGWVNKVHYSLCEGLGTPIWRMWCQLKTLFRNRWCALSSYARILCGWVHKVR